MFCQHFAKCCNIFQKYWFGQLFFVNILQNAATFLRNVGSINYVLSTFCKLLQHFLEILGKKYGIEVDYAIAGRPRRSVLGGAVARGATVAGHRAAREAAVAGSGRPTAGHDGRRAAGHRAAVTQGWKKMM
jgi:hypothetical protein